MRKRGLDNSKYGSRRYLGVDNNKNSESNWWRKLKSIYGKGKEKKYLIKALVGELEREITYIFRIIVGLYTSH